MKWKGIIFRRRVEKKENCFLSAEEYNELVSPEDGNCLSFSLGIVNNRQVMDFDLLTITEVEEIIHNQVQPQIDICEMFSKKVQQFGYNVRQVENMKDARGKVVFIVLGFYAQPIKPFGQYNYNFHIIRKNEDGTFEQKEGLIAEAKKISKYKVKKKLRSGIPAHYFMLC